MARSYHTDVVAFAADADQKWIDNLLSRFSIAGVTGGRQGVSRRVSTYAIYHVALTHLLVRSLGVPVAGAVGLANGLLSSSGDNVPVAPDVPHIRLAIDRATFIADVDRRIAEAAESLIPARRGRPARRGGV